MGVTLRPEPALTPLPNPRQVLSFWQKIRTPVLWALAIAYFSFAAILLSLRYWILPDIANYRTDLERIISSSLDLPVSIDTVHADWRGLRPKLILNGLKISDKQQRPALAFDRVDAVLGWSSLLHMNLRLHRLQLDGPEVAMRREADGQVFIAGLPINTTDEKSNFSEWVLAQEQIVINNAAISWHDAKRQAPPLTLKNAHLNLRNSGDRHQFALIAEPPETLAARIDVRGDFQGSDLAALESWQGKLYAELEYADLAVWRQWIDYPIDLPRGTGGVRMWLDFVQKDLSAATVDLLLADVNVRFGKNLPFLDLRRLQGRLLAKRENQRYSIEATGLSLATSSGIIVPSTDFRIALGHDAAGNPNRLEARATRLNLGKISALASYLPLPDKPREVLEQTQASGELINFSLQWDATVSPAKYAIKAQFADLGMAAIGSVPGARHVSGKIDGTEKGGEIRLVSKRAELDLPKIFAESRIPLEKLDAKLKWLRSAKGYTVSIDDFRFANADGEGSLQGIYSASAEGKGDIDLHAQLTRASGTAVWRYLPISVNKETRDWVKHSVTAGHSSDVKLILKGNLDSFPFRDKSGTFKVLVKAEGASILPAPGWPQIDNINGELAFINEGMLIDAKNGDLFGVRLSDVHAEIADLAADTQMLTIKGKAKGETQSFLKYIDASPIAKRINNFTTPMQATGSGELDLKLNLALHNIDSSTVEGRYRFDANRLVVGPVLPPLSDLRGELHFTGDSLTMRDARGTLLGAPLSVSINTGKEGIEAVADGQLNVAALRKQYALPVFDQLSGNTRWKARFSLRKDDVDVRLTSDLQGLASNLPEPFNKSAAAPMELRFERKVIPEPQKGKRNTLPLRREQSELVLGKQVKGQLLRILGSTESPRGYLQLGLPDGPAAPSKGIALNATLPRLDLDFWRRMLTADNAAAAAPDEAPPFIFPFTQADLRTGELVIMNRSLRDVRLSAMQSGRNWKADFRSKGVQAAIDWQPGQDGKPGRFIGRFPQLAIPDPNQQVVSLVSVSNQTISQLPTLSLNIDHLSLRGQDWGAVTLDAENRAGEWASKFSVNNEDGTLTGDAKWRPTSTQDDTHLNFQIKARSVEKLLLRAGYVDAIKRGSGTLDGELSWNDTPFAMDYPTLKGKVNIDMLNGQFKKLEPGIGRLLGVLSLQSLPRRVNLDFRDIFSDGFAFDSIRGEALVSQGTMQTERLLVTGPAAKIRLSGSVNLPQETQNLRVRVQPALGETMAVGVALAMANPAVGAAAWLANKALRDPVDQMFAFEYQVTGSWSEPQVARVDPARDLNQEPKREVAKEVDKSKETPKAIDKAPVKK